MKPKTLILILAALLYLPSASVRAEEYVNILDVRGSELAEQVQFDFKCEGRTCLDIAYTYGGEKNQIPEKYQELMAKKFALGPKSDKEGRAVAGILAVFIAACLWDEADCESVVINSAHRHKSGVGSARHTNKFGTRAFDMLGFKDTTHQVRFLSRMAMVSEIMGLRPNVGMGLVKTRTRAKGGKWVTYSYQSTHFDVNGHEISRNKKGRKKGCGCCACADSTTWTYGPLDAIQGVFRGIIGIGRDFGNFADKMFGKR